jgi:hypothetical protein
VAYGRRSLRGLGCGSRFSRLAGFDGGDHNGAGEKLAEQLMALTGGADSFGFHIYLIVYQAFAFLKSIPCAFCGNFHGFSLFPPLNLIP